MENTSFITNSETKKLKLRLQELIASSKELKFLVGFFYFSGISELYKSLKSKPDIVIRILVGLSVDKHLHSIVEYAHENYETLTGEEKFELFLKSIRNSINSDEFDNQEFYEQIHFFLNLIQEDRLQIRTTTTPNHSKLYFFKLESNQVKPSIFVTGSSNLTRAGLLKQNEFNVEISDYGNKEAEQYFDHLWENESDPITEFEEYKLRLSETIRKKTLVTQPTPYEAFLYVLKTYLDTQQHKEIKPILLDLLARKKYTTYKYQTDAVKQALSVIDNYGGVIISDVVGLGKSVIAIMLARSLGKRGLIICPPTLIGDIDKKSGWMKYKEDFQLYDWEIRSSGKLEQVAEFVSDKEDIEVVIIDEAHRFRNQDTQDYENLNRICRNKIVILLSATPFNNSPSDIFSLLKLFVIPGKSQITLEEDLDGKFREYKTTFTKLSYIKRYHNSNVPSKKKKAQNYYESLFEEKTINLAKVAQRAKYLASCIKIVLEPIMIRRNRLDLKNDAIYSREVKNLSEIKDPQELWFELTKEQSAFYDQIINHYFGDEGQFKGAIYRPYYYEEKGRDETDPTQEENREKITQDNLYDFMKRLLVKRFESSFGAFEQSIKNFISITGKVLEFIKNSNGQYILDRNLLQKIYLYDEDEIELELQKFSEKITDGSYPKSYKIYNLDKFECKDDFINDIKSDLALYNEVLSKLNKLHLVKNDPKLIRLIEAIKNDIPKNNEKKEPLRKVIVFSEYVDTIKYLTPILEKEFPDKIISVKGDLTPAKTEEILCNFDAIHKVKKSDFEILLTSDKLSEGFNLNRAGAVINYDIPWNPVRVVQRVGRINRISKKVFNNLYIYNFFPTEQGADVTKSRDIASSKMFMIHNTLGEDSKIFDIDEEPTPSGLFAIIQEHPEAREEESVQTKIRNIYFSVKDNNPEIIDKISDFPARIKVAKKFSAPGLSVFFKKGLGFHIKGMKADEAIAEYSIQEIFPSIECEPGEPGLSLSSGFWNNYKSIKEHKIKYKGPTSENSIEIKAKNLLKGLIAVKLEDSPHILPFLRTLSEDMREYKTLSDFTLRKIVEWDNMKDKHSLVLDVEKLKKELGSDYLLKAKETLNKLKNEIVIAIENR